ncbi:DUF6247 family protein [Thermoactinospora rubra]|uniref:DUF6247 family protein n=1 Tax=Thermoactinospora rubra TaxID=1088767 RepID=UPI000A11B19E|nr:DUF6247 family protein [Thermoactinospora rubra]
MSEQPVEPHPAEHDIRDAHDPGGILARLPERYRDRFLGDYRAAMRTAAREPWRWGELTDTLDMWHRRSVAYSRPGYEQARAEAAAGVDGVPAEDVIPGWFELVAGRESRRP